MGVCMRVYSLKWSVIYVTCSTNSCNGATEVCVYSSDVIPTTYINMAS